MTGPRPVVGVPPDWTELASCATSAFPDLWFAHPEEHATTMRAKRACHDCPVMTACLNAAMSRDERFGVWGGLDVAERDALASGGPSPRNRKPCGTVAAYRRHVRSGEVPCRPCVDAVTADNRARRERAS